MCVEPFVVLEQGAKRQRNLPMLIPFGPGRKRARVPQDIAPMLNKLGFIVERLVQRQFTSNRRHGSHLHRHRVNAGDRTNLHPDFSELVVKIAQLPGFVEVGQRELSWLVGICVNLSEATVITLACALARTVLAPVQSSTGYSEWPSNFATLRSCCQSSTS